MSHQCPHCGSNRTQPARVVVNGQSLLRCQICQRMFVPLTRPASLAELVRIRPPDDVGRHTAPAD